MKIKYFISKLALVSGLLVASCGSEDDFTPPQADIEQDTAACSLPPRETRCPSEPEVVFANGCSPFVGSEAEPEVEVVAFSNFHCPHCAMFAAMVDELFARRGDLRDKVRIYFHHYPFDFEGDWNIHAAARAAQLQGEDSFWVVHDSIYDRVAGGKSVDAGHVVELAREELGLDMERFEQDRKSDTTMSFLAWDRDQAISKGVSGTPAVFVCGQAIDWRTLEHVLDRLLGLAPAGQ